MFSSVLFVKNGHCPLCGTPDADGEQRLVLNIDPSGEPLLTPSEAHSAVCDACWAQVAQNLQLQVEERKHGRRAA